MGKAKTGHAAAKPAVVKKAAVPVKAGTRTAAGVKAPVIPAAKAGPVVHRLEPVRAETQARVELKERLAKLGAATSKIGALKRAINKNFFDIGVVLNQIRDEKLYEVKGYGSFEAFIEREIDINRIVCLRSARVAEVMTREVALGAGLERAAAAVAVLDGELGVEEPGLRPMGSPFPSIPLHKQ